MWRCSGMSEAEAAVCAICLEECTSTDEYKLSCQHVFHASCLVPWLLAGRTTCPTCRGSCSETTLGPLTLEARASYLRRTVARRKSAPALLLKLVEDVRKAESAESAMARLLRAHRTEHKEVYKIGGRLRRQRWMASRKTRIALRVLGSFDCDELRLPPVAQRGAF